ncbi:MAG: ATP-binding cassette domain-containing protein [Huintestinicola sp.]
MLKLKNIVKNYTAGDTEVAALKGIDITFRESEFVSILGPSGCGKTTMLNIIGGLDRYTSGDLVINGKSTRDFNDGDWDSYRNHSVGFVFQSYNLIPHQSVLANVELALTLSGVSKDERRKRAEEALKKVGLGDQIHKKPNQMSGGQMQRVAIARALVNNPDILLADEPTGALDSETSVQIMELLKEISKDKLIIMVTHNPELAKDYSTRIISLLDGKVTNDTMPYIPDESAEDEEKKRAGEAKKVRKPSMSFGTAVSLSLNNLMTKKARTFLTSFAGSIGIIGIALILAISTGVNDYINDVQEDTLSSYPITIQAESVDMSDLITTLMGSNENQVSHGKDKIYSNSVTYELLDSITDTETTSSNLNAFKKFLESETEFASDSKYSAENAQTDLNSCISAISYTYDMDMNIYTKDPDGTIVKSDVMDLLNDLMSSFFGSDISIADTPMLQMSSAMGGGSQYDVWEEMLSGRNGELVNDLLREQYDVIYGSWPESYDEIVLVVDENNEISDIALYALGLKNSEELIKVRDAVINGESIETETESWDYADMCSMTFRLVPSCDIWQYDEMSKTYSDLTSTEAGMNYLYDNGIELRISGIIRPSEDAVASMLKGSIGYTSALTNYVINHSEESEIIKAQLADSTVDVFTGKTFKANAPELSEDEKAELFKDYAAALTDSEKAELYVAIMSVPSDEFVASAVEQQMTGMTRESIEQMMSQSYAEQTGMDNEKITEYISSMDDETLFSYLREYMAEAVKTQYAEEIRSQTAQLSAAQLSAAFSGALADYTTAQLAEFYETYCPSEYSDATYEDNLKLLGDVDITTPTTVSIYASTFEDKDIIADIITDYNDSVPEDETVTYTDYVALMMSSITTIINVISYVLIAFVAISLVVSSIMIGIITYISVLERTKEIGILRAIGASKRDVSRVFNAETLIVGFTAGAIGIGATLLLCIPINIIVHNLTGIYSINAVLPAAAGVILILISMFLTFIAGLFPSRIAAKKDPVIALRSE